MAKLGDAFSEDDRRVSIVRRLVPGAVIYLEVAFPEGARSKYLVVAHVDEHCCTFVVNSEVNPFIAARPELLICQVKIDVTRHAFLLRDSHVACHQVLRLPTQAVVREILDDMSRLKGTIHAEVRSQIVAALKRAPTLTPAEQTLFANALDRAED